MASSAAESPSGAASPISAAHASRSFHCGVLPVDEGRLARRGSDLHAVRAHERQHHGQRLEVLDVRVRPQDVGQRLIVLGLHRVARGLAVHPVEQVRRPGARLGRRIAVRLDEPRHGAVSHGAQLPSQLGTQHPASVGCELNHLPDRRRRRRMGQRPQQRHGRDGARHRRLRLLGEQRLEQVVTLAAARPLLGSLDGGVRAPVAALAQVSQLLRDRRCRTRPQGCDCRRRRPPVVHRVVAEWRQHSHRARPP